MGGIEPALLRTILGDPPACWAWAEGNNDHPVRKRTARAAKIPRACGRTRKRGKGFSRKRFWNGYEPAFLGLESYVGPAPGEVGVVKSEATKPSSMRKQFRTRKLRPNTDKSPGTR